MWLTYTMRIDGALDEVIVYSSYFSDAAVSAFYSSYPAVSVTLGGTITAV